MLADLIKLFPNLTLDSYRRTSLPTIAYNCVAFAFDDQTQWWEPDDIGFWYWPTRRAHTLRAWIDAAKSQGFAKCADGTLEVGFDKIVIYAIDRDPTHIARQQDNNLWASKLGDLDDITHTLRGLEGDRYGKPVVFMQRKKK